MKINVGDKLEKDGAINVYTVQHIGEMSMAADYLYKDTFVVLADRHGLLDCFTKSYVVRNFTLVPEQSEPNVN